MSTLKAVKTRVLQDARREIAGAGSLLDQPDYECNRTGPGALIQGVISSFYLDEEEYRQLGRECPWLYDARRLDLYEEGEGEEYSREEIFAGNLEAELYDHIWQWWDHRFDGRFLIVVSLSRNTMRLIDAIDKEVLDAYLPAHLQWPGVQLSPVSGEHGHGGPHSPGPA
jgi:hypothetical protein